MAFQWLQSPPGGTINDEAAESVRLGDSYRDDDPVGQSVGVGQLLPHPGARASRSYFSILRNSSKLCGSTSGTTCTCVVNLYGAFASPLSNTSSTKNAVQPDSGFSTRPTYTPLPSASSGDDLYALPIVSNRKSRALGLVACQRFTAFGFVSVWTVIEPSFSIFHLNFGTGDPAT